MKKFILLYKYTYGYQERTNYDKFETREQAQSYADSRKEYVENEKYACGFEYEILEVK